MTVEIPWTSALTNDGQYDHVPTIRCWLFGSNDQAFEEQFLIDSGADVSLAPRRLLDELQLDWNQGQPMTLHGISPREECAVQGRLFEIEVAFPDAECSLPIPMCFGDGDVTCLLGRKVFFDAFNITFRKAKLTTSLELLLYTLTFRTFQ